MATTSYVDTACSAELIGSRTTSAGVAATDVNAEEFRLINGILSEGYLTANAFKVSATTGMNLTVGSGAAKSDVYAVAGDIAGQGTYLVRLEGATAAVTVPAADASARTDEIYLVVADAAYDSGSVSLPRIGYRKGTAGGGAPGADTAWKASVKLATIAVGGSVSSITSGNITDNRVSSALSLLTSAADPRYLGVAAKAADSELLDGIDSTGFARVLSSATVATAQSTSSGTYGDLATVGPQITVTMPPSGSMNVTVGARMNPGVDNENAKMSFQINSTAAADANALVVYLPASSGDQAMSRTSQVVGTPGATYVLTAKYLALGSGAVTFADRNISAAP